MSAHQFTIGSNDLIKSAQTTVFSQNIKQVGGQLVRLLYNTVETAQFGSAGNSGVFQEALEGFVLLDSLSKSTEIFFDSIKAILTSSSSIKSSSVATFKTKKGNGSLMVKKKKERINKTDILM